MPKFSDISRIELDDEKAYTVLMQAWEKHFTDRQKIVKLLAQTGVLHQHWEVLRHINDTFLGLLPKLTTVLELDKELSTDGHLDLLLALQAAIKVPQSKIQTMCILKVCF